MKIVFTPEAAAHIDYWRAKDEKMLQKIKSLLAAIQVAPFTGIGKPEPLRFGLSGYWSRRIRKDHRLVYRISGAGDRQVCEVYSCRFHYET